MKPSLNINNHFHAILPILRLLHEHLNQLPTPEFIHQFLVSVSRYIVLSQEGAPTKTLTDVFIFRHVLLVKQIIMEKEIKMCLCEKLAILGLP